MTSPLRLPLVSAPPTAVETELAGLVGNASQRNLAEVLGLSGHRTINDRLSRVANGLADSYGETLTFEQGVKLARAHAPLGMAVAAYIRGEDSQAAPAAICAEVSREISDDAALIAACNDALSDGKIDRAERRRLVAALRESMNRRATLILHLDTQGD